mmetsp:Transcript_11058/g.20263  ORF Transcript_11058/g.20263 Transcript_11058/m.20263 type:complete len:224 (+) Transcript_11058:132-803(+)
MAPNKTAAAAVFRRIDANGDGKISRAEYAAALKILDIPKAMAQVVTDAVFAKYDANDDGGIDEKEFLCYFDSESNVAMHGRINRAIFEKYYSFFWSLYFIVCGTNFVISPFGSVDATFGGLGPDDGPGFRHASAHLFVIIGLTWATNGLVVIAQRVLKLSTVTTLAALALFWFMLTLYENVIGSIIATPGFKAPPLPVTILSGILAFTGLWGMFSGKVKIKED